MNLSEVSTAFPFPSSRERLRAVGRGQGWGAKGDASRVSKQAPTPTLPAAPLRSAGGGSERLRQGHQE